MIETPAYSELNLVKTSVEQQDIDDEAMEIPALEQLHKTTSDFIPVRRFIGSN